MKKRRRHSGGNLFGALAFCLFSVIFVVWLQEQPYEIKLQEASVEAVADVKPEETEYTQNTVMEVHFIDVGQSDCTLIKNGEYAMLIDAGDNDKGTAVQKYLQTRGVEKLDYLVLTHTDADHIGGADVVLTKFDVDTVFMGDYEKDNATYRDVIDTLEYKQLSWSTPQVGEIYTLGDASFTIIAPNTDYDTPNNTSIGLILEKGEVRFAFTGDAEKEAERDIVQNGLDLSVDVYQVGHHGSSSSSSAALLDAFKPSYAVISCGKDNPYGYPHREVIEAFRERGIEVFRTDEQGNIVAVCDGESITWDVDLDW